MRSVQLRGGERCQQVRQPIETSTAVLDEIYNNNNYYYYYSKKKKNRSATRGSSLTPFSPVGIYCDASAEI